MIYWDVNNKKVKNLTSKCWASRALSISTILMAMSASKQKISIIEEETFFIGTRYQESKEKQKTKP